MLYRAFLISIVAVALVAAFVGEFGEQTHLARAILGFFAILVGVIAVWSSLFKSDENKEGEERRDKLIHVIRKIWIDGVLADALRDAAVDIDVKPTPEQTAESDRYANYQMPQRGVATVLRGPDGTAEKLENTPEIVARTFHNVNEKLLILGAPGSGKSVLLLQLAERLLAEATEKSYLSVPIVFNLATWAIKRQPLNEWLIEELQRPTYSVSKKYAKQLVEGNQLIFLLDGLDEVAEAHRKTCVNAINNFITPERQLVVCSRTKEYGELAAKLDAHYAIEIQPLSQNEFRKLLFEGISKVNTVNQIITMLTAEEDVWHEANKPLFLNILISTYRDGTPFREYIASGSALEQIQQSIIEPYITRQLRNGDYPSNDARRYLAWIAYQLREHSQTAFFIEMLQLDWLLSSARLPYRISMFLLFGLVAGLYLGPIPGIVIFYSIKQVLDINISKVLGISIGIAYSLILGMCIGWASDRIDVELQESNPSSILGSFIDRLYRNYDSEFVQIFDYLSLIFSFFYWFGLFHIYSMKDKAYLGQRLSTSGVLGFGMNLVYSLVILFLYMPLLHVFGLRILNTFVILSVVFAVVFGFSHMIKNLVLRGILYGQSSFPFKYDRLLYHARDARIMRQVGGSFMFIHRYILDYFADYYEKHYLPESERTQ